MYAGAMMNDNDRDLCSIHSLARRLRLDENWLRIEADAGRLPCLQAGRKRLFSERAVREALARMAGAGPSLREQQERGGMMRPADVDMMFGHPVGWAEAQARAGRFPCVLDAAGAIWVSREDIDRIVATWGGIGQHPAFRRGDGNGQGQEPKP